MFHALIHFQIQFLVTDQETELYYSSRNIPLPVNTPELIDVIVGPNKQPEAKVQSKSGEKMGWGFTEITAEITNLKNTDFTSLK